MARCVTARTQHRVNRLHVVATQVQLQNTPKLSVFKLSINKAVGTTQGALCLCLNARGGVSGYCVRLFAYFSHQLQAWDCFWNFKKEKKCRYDFNLYFKWGCGGKP